VKKADPYRLPKAKRFQSSESRAGLNHDQRCFLPVAATAAVASATTTEAMASATTEAVASATTEAMSSAETATTTGGSPEVVAATAEATHRTATEAGVIARSDSHGRALRRRKAPCRSSLRRYSR
jgi:hypothetical protein